MFKEKLTDTKLRSLKPQAKAYQRADGGGLFLEVLPGGAKVWRLRYRLGGRQEKVTFGHYPDIGLAAARRLRDEARARRAAGGSPMRERAEEKARVKADLPQTAEALAQEWFTKVVTPANKAPRNIRRVLTKDILPAFGKRAVAAVTIEDVQRVIDRVKARGADQMALQTRNVMKRLFAYAISRGLTKFNPAAAIEAKYIAQAKSRDVALTPAEIGTLLSALYRSSLKRQFKLAFHLLLVTMLRKGELVAAKWSEIDFQARLWTVPAERMKMRKAHLVPLAPQALAMLEELRTLACGSEWVIPSRSTIARPISLTTLNAALRALDLPVRDFVIHDFRRTASTLLNEQGFNSDVVEKALAHEQGGVRGVYNRAQYLDQRRAMLQAWADFVDAQTEDRGRVLIGRFGKAFSAA